MGYDRQSLLMLRSFLGVLLFFICDSYSTAPDVNYRRIISEIQGKSIEARGDLIKTISENGTTGIYDTVKDIDSMLNYLLWINKEERQFLVWLDNWPISFTESYPNLIDFFPQHDESGDFKKYTSITYDPGVSKNDSLRHTLIKILKDKIEESKSEKVKLLGGFLKDITGLTLTPDDKERARLFVEKYPKSPWVKFMRSNIFSFERQVIEGEAILWDIGGSFWQGISNKKLPNSPVGFLAMQLMYKYYCIGIGFYGAGKKFDNNEEYNLNAKADNPKLIFPNTSLLLSKHFVLNERLSVEAGIGHYYQEVRELSDSIGNKSLGGFHGAIIKNSLIYFPPQDLPQNAHYGFRFSLEYLNSYSNKFGFISDDSYRMSVSLVWGVAPTIRKIFYEI